MSRSRLIDNSISNINLTIDLETLLKRRLIVYYSVKVPLFNLRNHDLIQKFLNSRQTLIQIESSKEGFPEITDRPVFQDAKTTPSIRSDGGGHTFLSYSTINVQVAAGRTSSPAGAAAGVISGSASPSPRTSALPLQSMVWERRVSAESW